MIRRVPTRLIVALLVSAAAMVGCEDDRGDPTAPDPGVLDADSLYGSAQVSATFLQVMNAFAERVLDVHESQTTLPVQFPGCTGPGRAVISSNLDADPNTYRVTFGNSAGTEQFVVFCDGLNLRLTQKMIFTLLETSPSLVYEVEMPFNELTGVPEGVTLILPANAGGVTLQITTPRAPLEFRLEGPRSADARHAGFVHVSGTLRFEDRASALIFVEELRLEYAFNDDVIPKFAPWPAGSYEIASNGASGIPGGPPVPGFPLEVFFDGFGGALFEIDGTVCETNLATGVNPCEGL